MSDASLPQCSICEQPEYACECDPNASDFLNTLVARARQFGWEGDYTVVVDFVRFCFDHEGMDPPEKEQLEPY